MTVYTLGPAGTFSHEATLTIFPDADIRFAPNFDRLFDRAAGDKNALGVVPVENSLHGSIDEILDLLRETDVKIWRMQDVRIRHAFGCQDPTTITTIASHPQALRQSRLWLKKHYPEAIHLSTASTAAAVELAKKDPTVGAVASAKLMKQSGVTIVSEDVEGNDNTTRFAIIAKTDPFPASPKTHMSIAIHPPKDDRPGLLHQLLTPFKVYDINMTRIENRPTGKRLGDYNFFIDFAGSIESERTKKLLQELQISADIRIIGEW